MFMFDKLFYICKILHVMILGKRIKNKRTEAKLKQEQLAQLSGISTEYLSKIERGKVKNVGIEKLYKIAHALGVHITDILPLKTENEEAA